MKGCSSCCENFLHSYGSKCINKFCFILSYFFCCLCCSYCEIESEPNSNKDDCEIKKEDNFNIQTDERSIDKKADNFEKMASVDLDLENKSN